MAHSLPKSLLALLLASLLSSCGTVGTKLFYNSLPEEERPVPGYYSGLRGDLQSAPILWHGDPPGGPAWKPVRKVYAVLFLLIDVPLSTAADTVILPFEFLVRALGDSPERKTSPKEGA